MSKVRNILVPVDFSGNSIKALQYGINLAKKGGFKLFILHSYRLILAKNDQKQAEGKQLKEILETESWRRFKSLEKKHLMGANIDYELALELGFTVDVICRFVKTHHIDLIVMGTKGATGIQGILGSTTLNVLENTSLPMLIIPKKAKISANENITIASNFDYFPDKNHAEMIITLAKLLNANIDVLNINNKRKVSMADINGKLFLDELFNDVPLNYHFEMHRNVEEGINKYISRHPTDMLVMFPRDPKYFEKLLRLSLTRKFVLHSNIPILTIHRC